MCMGPTHRIAGAYAGALWGWHTGLPMWACAGTAAIATVTAAGRASPDMDQYKLWKKIDRWTPDEALGWGGPMKHRGLTHFPGVPLLAWYWLHGAILPTPLAVVLWALLIGWASHLALDFVWGRAFGDRGKGVPLFGWAGYVGVGLKADGVTAWLFSAGLVTAPFVMLWQAATS